MTESTAKAGVVITDPSRTDPMVMRTHFGPGNRAWGCRGNSGPWRVDSLSVNLMTVNRWKDWYEQGKRNLARARLDLEHEFHEWACFTSQQAAELLLKAVGLKIGVTLWGHSLSEILGLLSVRIEVPPDILAKAQTLDFYYIPARYPNGFASGKPADYFNRGKAKEALDAASDIQRFCEGFLL